MAHFSKNTQILSHKIRFAIYCSVRWYARHKLVHLAQYPQYRCLTTSPLTFPSPFLPAISTVVGWAPLTSDGVRGAIRHESTKCNCEYMHPGSGIGGPGGPYARSAHCSSPSQDEWGFTWRRAVGIFFGRRVCAVRWYARHKLVNLTQYLQCRCLTTSPLTFPSPFLPDISTVVG
jgi:hypothetical protein